VTAGDHEQVSALERPDAQPSEQGEHEHEHGVLEEHGEPEQDEWAPGQPALAGPFTTRQLLRLDEALRVADQQTGLTFSVYLGDLEEPVRAHAERLHKQIGGADRAVLLAVSPNQRLLEIVTGNEARKRISDRDAKLAALSMAASFAGGDLAGGVLSGLDQLASHAGRH
jgi:hypothetical protein